MRTRALLVAALIALLATGLLGPALAQDGARPYIGIRFEQTDDGALIGEVVPDSPAAAAGLRAGDLITAVDGTPVSLDSPLIPLVEDRAPGDTITLTLERGGETLEIALTLGVFPEELAESEAGAEPESEAALRRHISVAGAVFMDLGARWPVVEVAPGTAAAEAGLQPGDLLTHIDGIAVDGYDSGVLASRAAAGAELALTVRRGAQTLDLTLVLDPGTPLTTTVRPGAIPQPLTDAVPVEPLPGVPLPLEEEPQGYLGVSYVPLTAEILAMLAADEALPFALPVVEEGALIIGIQEDTPAAGAGLLPGDVITRVDGDAVDAERTLVDRINAYEAGDTVALEVWRGEEMLAIEVTLIARPAEMGILVLPQGRVPLAPFMNPDFDLERFLEEYPGFLDDLREFGLTEMFGPRFDAEDFDWGGFLEAYPGFITLLEQLSESFTADELLELFPDFPWFSEADPFHEDVDPRLPMEGDNAPA